MAAIPGLPNPIDIASHVLSDPIGAATDPIGTVTGGGQKPQSGDIG